MTDPNFVSSGNLRKRFDAVRTIDPNSVIPKGERYKASIMDVKNGGAFIFNGNVCVVNRFGRYEEWDEKYTKKGDYTSHELRLLDTKTGETIILEWEEDCGELKVSISTAQAKFRELRDDEGGRIDDDDLETIIDDEESVFFEGIEFEYDDDWVAKYIPDGKRKGENACIYEFEAADGTCLTIEEWGDGEKSSDYEIWISKSIDPDTIEIISLGG